METLLPRLLEQGGVFALAVLVVWWNRQDAREDLERERADKLMLAEVLRENTRALEALKAAVSVMMNAHHGEGGLK